MNLNTLQMADGKCEAIDVSEYKLALSRFPTGVTVVTTVGEGGRPVGLTVNSFASVSLEPPVVLWSLRQASSSFAQFMAAEAFAINVLACEQQEWVYRFASSHADRFAGISYHRGMFGLPVLAGAVATFECRKAGADPVGDHVVFLGQVLRFSSSSGEPLVMHSGGFANAVSQKAVSLHSERMVDESISSVARAA